MQAKPLRFSNVISVYISPHVLCSSDAYAYHPFSRWKQYSRYLYEYVFWRVSHRLFLRVSAYFSLELIDLHIVCSCSCPFWPVYDFSIYILCVGFFFVVASPLTLCDIISFPHVSFTLCLVTCDEGQDDAVFFFNEYYEEQIMWTTTAIATTTINNNPAPKKAGPPHTTTRYVLEIKLFRKS